MERGKALVRDAFLAAAGPVKSGYAEAPRAPRVEAKRGGAIHYQVTRVSATRGIWTETREKARPWGYGR